MFQRVLIAGAFVLTSVPAALAADCDPAQEAQDIGPALAEANATLAANPTEDNMATMMELNQKMSEAGALAGSDADAACALYAEVRETLAAVE